MLLNKKILVAGAGGLLGVEIVKALIEKNATIIATDINLKQTKQHFSRCNIDINTDKIELVELDLNNEQEVTNFFTRIDGLSGAVNASYPRNKTYGAHFFDVSLKSFNENLNLHLGSSFLFMQQCAAYFTQHKQAFSVINISSIYGTQAPDFSIYENTDMTMPVEYAAIKSAIIHLNKYISNYIKSSDFRVNSISPGGIQDQQPENFLASYQQKTNGAGMLTPDAMTGAIIFLLSDQAQYITGQNIIIDDGFHI